MKLKIIALIAALAVPALGWAATSLASNDACPIPCQDCPFAKR